MCVCVYVCICTNICVCVIMQVCLSECVRVMMHVIACMVFVYVECVCVF